MSVDSKTCCSKDEEYETQHFGFSTSDLYCFVEETVHAEISSAASKMRHTLLKTAAGQDEGVTDSALKAVVKMCVESSKTPLETWKRQLPKFFSLPPHILLREDKRQRERYTQEDEENIKGEINKLKSRLRRAEFLKVVCEEELGKTKVLEQPAKLLDEVWTDIKALNSKISNGDDGIKKSRALVQDIFGLDVKEASLKPSHRPSCADSEEVFEEAIVGAYIRS